MPSRAPEVRTPRWIALLVALVGAPALAQVTVNVPATSDPYLAGMPNGSTCCSGDSAPAQSPVPVTGIAVTPGTILTFSASGAIHFEPGPLSPTPDGSFTFTTVATNGISGATWPVDALVGVFLDGNLPTATATPPALDFGSTGLGTSFALLTPALKQVFFIGDGRTGTGSGATQSFVVPAGATRLFLAVSDGVGWFNNVGSFSVTVTPLAAPPVPVADIPLLAPWLLVLMSAAVGAFALRSLRRR